MALDALPCSSFIAEERPGDIAGEEEECREREVEEREDDKGDVLGEMKAIGRAGVEHCSELCSCYGWVKDRYVKLSVQASLPRWW